MPSSLISQMIFICALRCEAQPLIEHFRLKHISSALFPVYGNESFSLVISGIGKIASAAAVSYMHALNQHALSCWLNIGTCGHKDDPLGKGYIGHKIMDAQNHFSFYPTLIGKLPCPVACIKSVERPEKQYPEDVLYDMEASGFYQMASKASTTELVHCFKVVSDNHTHPTDQVSSETVSTLIRSQLPCIEKLTQWLHSLQKEITFPFDKDIEKLTKNIHFTQTQLHQLNRLYTRWKALTKSEALPDALYQIKQAKELFVQFEKLIEQQPLTF